MRKLALGIGALALAACGSQPEHAEEPAATASATTAPATTATPDLAACARPAPLEASERLRTEAIPVPAALRSVMRTDMENLAVSTLAGRTVCVDASWMETLDNATFSSDGRFASFDWFGYEAFGHVIVDRSGQGLAIETGVAPLASPSGKLLAANDITESGYGPLNAFTVWRIEREGIRQLAGHEDVPAAADWKVERWAGESCVEQSAIPWEVYADPEAPDDPPRARFHARSGAGWRVEPGPCPAA